jgi:hypothetical protein
VCRGRASKMSPRIYIIYNSFQKVLKMLEIIGEKSVILIHYKFTIVRKLFSDCWQKVKKTFSEINIFVK